MNQLQRWLTETWGRVDSLISPDGSYPPPLIAQQGTELAGGLSFTTATLPDAIDTGIWVNTLYVAPTHRERGLGTLLIEHAAQAASAFGLQKLYVFTEIPALYQSIGWQNTNTQHVLFKSL